jgi:hypothetical protein
VTGDRKKWTAARVEAAAASVEESVRRGTMDSQHSSSGRNPVRGALRGAFRSLRLGWTDPVSGERLTIDADGDSSFFESLEPLGFERVGEAPELAPEGGSEGAGEPIQIRSFRARAARARGRSVTKGTAATG